MSVEFQSFVLQRDLKLLWKKAARAEQISRSEFLRRALRERAGQVLAAGKSREFPEPEHDTKSNQKREGTVDG
jgi:uncharacterized protein (DUF1778 family)